MPKQTVAAHKHAHTTAPSKKGWLRLPRLGLRAIKQSIGRFWRKNWFTKVLSILISIVIVFLSGMYGVAQWYILKHRNEPLTIGATFIPDYARYFGLDAQETMQAMIDDLGIRSFRLVSYWDKIEAVQGTYDFTDLDWQFKLAEESGSTVSLALGIRQPRWPECHPPTWAANAAVDDWLPPLKNFMGAVIARYKDSPALKSYQLENEFFLSVFGECKDFSRWRLVDEFNYVKSQDSAHPVIISRSNNWIGLPLGDPRPDEFAISVYKRVWDKTITKRYFEYPLPAWFYASLAGGAEILTGRNMIIHELQTEAWVPDSFNGIINAPLEEAYKSLSPERLKSRINYGVATGMKDINLWGVEWWYYAKTKLHDPALWNAAKEQIQIERAHHKRDS